MIMKYLYGLYPKLATNFILVVVISATLTTTCTLDAWALASNNIPLDSPVYDYIDKLAGFGLITSDIKGLKPFSRAEAARLYLEAEANLTHWTGTSTSFATELMKRLRELLPREIGLHDEPDKAPVLDYNVLSNAKIRYVFLAGEPRSYNRQVFIHGGQSAFGFIGGKLRPDDNSGVLSQSGTEGTPLIENNEGINYQDGNNAEIRWAFEGFVKDEISFLIEPDLLVTSTSDKAAIQKGYIKVGSGGLELEVGRDANWFGPGFRGALTLTNNAKNFDIIKFSSPEPVDIGWVNRYLGETKYCLIFSRFNETGSGTTLRKPYFIGAKLAVKPKKWFEVGVNFVRQEGGPGFSGSTTLRDTVFGGGTTNHNNSIAGIDLRFRIPWLKNVELYGEYAGEDSASFWPIVESYVAGFYIPSLTSAGNDDLRFEFFYGNPMLYTDSKFPHGYVYYEMTPGHSQGGSALEFYSRYNHWFSARNKVALEYFHTDRGREGRVGNQQTEYKNAWRVSWSLPLSGDWDMNVLYGYEFLKNADLVAGVKRQNQIFTATLSYRY